MRIRRRLKLRVLMVLTGFWFALSPVARASAPPTPTAVSATPGNGQVTLRWSATITGGFYRLKRATTSGGPYQQIAVPTWNGYTDVSVKNGVTYFYTVSAVTSSGESSNSSQVSAKPVALTAPTGLSAQPGDSQVTLRWSADATATSYHLKRATSSGGSYTQIANASWTGYTDTGVDNGKTYFYTVSAVNSGGESANSSQVSAKPVAQSTLTAPAGLTATSGNAQVSLTWSATPLATGYHVKRATSAGGPYTQVAAPTWHGYTEVGLQNGITYYYVVSAVNATEESAVSPDVSATPGTTALTADFFGLSWSALQASHFPSVPFGGIRAWDTGTSWTEIETSQGTYNWATLDTWLLMESSHGKDVMYTFGFVPHWASMRPSEACSYVVTDPGCAAPPSDVDSGDNIWKAFVTALVKHSLSSPDLHIAYYELWNEPDLKRNWTGTPAQLVTMAKDAYAIIHKLDPSARVIGPSPSTANKYGVHFLPAYYAAGGATAQDFVGMHAYLYDGTAFSTSPAGITLTISELEALMATYGISDKSIWFTEGNWGDVNNTSMTGAQKAAYIAQEYLLMWSSGKVDRFYWYAWDSSALGTLWNSSSGINTAGVAYGRLADWLVGSVHQGQPCSEGADATWTCKLTLANGYPGEVIWNASTSKTVAVSAGYATYETLADSAVHSIQASKVAIGSEPILLVGSQAGSNP